MDKEESKSELQNQDKKVHNKKTNEKRRSNIKKENTSNNEVLETKNNKKTENKEEVKKQNEKKEDNNKSSKKKSNKIRMGLVALFLIIFSLVAYVLVRGSYLEYFELGENYVDVFNTNLTYKLSIMGANFVFLYFVMYLTNKSIKKGLSAFFKKENKKMPKLLNKSIALVISEIASAWITSISADKIILLISNASFGKTDPIFNLDIAYYIFQKPVIEMFIIYFITLVVGLTIYMAIYYIIVFNKFFDGIDGKMLLQSDLIKKVRKNIILVAIGITLITIVSTQNILFGQIVQLDNEVGITGAGSTEATIKLWGYLIFSVIILVVIYKAVKHFTGKNIKETLKILSVIPGYLVALFIVMLVYNLIFVKPNELDKQKEYLEYNIENTKIAYNIDINEENLEDSGTITQEEVSNNANTINNIPVMSQDELLKTLEDTQTGTGYYSYSQANIAKYNINGQEQLVYVSPRQIASSGRTYVNKTYEYTHGMGLIIASATSSTNTGAVNYIQKNVSGIDNQIQITQPRTYFGTQSNTTVATNTKNKQEYDYTDESGNDYTSTYEGNAGLNLNFVDRLILGITKGDVNLAFSGEITEDSKILINRNITERAKKALPNLIYDDNPYSVVTDEGKIVWVLDAYTVSSNYPYSQYTSIVHDNRKEKINYIRNSVKVIIDAYDGTMKFYITDRTDPIAMAYRNIYPTLFENLDTQISSDISSHFVYPQYLYKIQSEMLGIYHNVKPEVLYRSDDIWSIAKYNSTSSTKSTGTQMEPYYTMVKTKENNDERLGLVQIYTPEDKQNLISYLVGSTSGSTNELKLYKFSQDSSIVGPMQLDKQIEADTTISEQLTSISKTGTKITKNMIVVPINNTLLYVEPVYQTMLNESNVPILKKVIVASGNKVAIGDNLTQALTNLLSKYAVDIEVESTDNINDLIDLIIKANNNLTKSNESNDWEMMGKDTQKLQELINSLQKLKEEEEKKKSQNTSNTTNTSNVTDNITDNIAINANNNVTQ